MASMLFCLLSGVKTQEKIKNTELELRAVKTLWGDEWDYEPRCGTPEKAIR